MKVRGSNRRTHGWGSVTPWTWCSLSQWCSLTLSQWGSLSQWGHKIYGSHFSGCICSAPIGTHIVSFTHNVRFSVKGLTFHTHCWRKLTLPYLAEVQQIPTSPNCPNIEQTCLNLLKRLTNAPYVQPCIIHDVACTLKRKDKPFLMQR